jgi:hypothetical protein
MLNTILEEVSCADVLRLYRDRGTCEQYFTEIKSELDLERLPSGKFCGNELFFQLGMFVNNMLLIMGKGLARPGDHENEEGHAQPSAYGDAESDVYVRSGCAPRASSHCAG